MWFVITVIGIGVLAWRYRHALGLDQRLDAGERPSAGEIARQLGWRQGAKGSSSAVELVEADRRAGGTRRSLFDAIDSSRLPTALVTGGVVAVIVLALELQGYSFLASLVALALGPFFGGAYVRSWWWLLVAAAVAIVVGGGSRIGGFVIALPVAAIALGGIQTDLRGWLARWKPE